MRINKFLLFVTISFTACEIALTTQTVDNDDQSIEIEAGLVDCYTVTSNLEWDGVKKMPLVKHAD